MIDIEDNPDIAKRNAEVSFVLFVLGGVVGLLNLTTTLPFGAGFEMFALATNLAKYGTYANPFLVLQTGPSAVSPPLYPLLLALFMKVLRVPAFVLLAAALGNIFANALTAAWLPRVSWLFYDDVGPGVAASLLWLMATQLMPSWEASYTVAALLLFCLFTAATVGKTKIIIFGAFAGLLAGALLLLNPVSLLVYVPWVVYLLVFNRAPLKRTAAYVCIGLAVAALAVFPWTLRNDRQLGGFVVRTSLGLTLYAANNDCARPSQMEEQLSGCYEIYHPNYSLSEAQTLRNLGELNYDRQRLADTKAWVRAHPELFLRLTVARVRDFWFPRRVEHPFKVAVIWVATILSIPGLALMAYRRERVTVFVLCVLLIYPLMYYIIFSDVRFRYPVLWLSLLPAGYFLEWLAQLGQAKWKLKPS
ncbi:MAG TPA: hypothetical protein VGT08_10565 [Terracidiphilus sp.]|nr:hypothetical protein [Terracidiphilus sp.]